MRLAIFEIIFFAVPLGLLVLAVTRNRPTPERFALANELQLDQMTTAEVNVALVRTRRGRVLGASLGCATGFALGVLLSQVLDIVTFWTTLFSTTGGILVGTLVGIALVQTASLPDKNPTREASLAIRDVRSYRTRFGTLLLRVALVIFLVAAGLTVIAAQHNVPLTIGSIAFVTVGVLAFTMLASRLSVRIVERGRDRIEAGHARVDDALRSSAVRAIQHATVGILACGIGVLGIIAIQTQTYQAVTVDGRSVFVVPDGGSLVRVVDGGDLTTVVTQTTRMRIEWRDRDGINHTTVRTRPPAVYFGSGTYIESDLAIAIGSFALIIGWFGGLIEWSRAAKAWRRPGPFGKQPKTPVLALGAIA